MILNHNDLRNDVSNKRTVATSVVYTPKWPVRTQPSSDKQTQQMHMTAG